ncbi:hypothetical protein MUO14_15970 [Halobacillus shinanisalinarum]|uniref:Uncharacterized protein n=1 Tax=Halobacillus shinanisalinarum TaxID=2932258 RepID=A0ABY4GV03_9BACI|nr:hypothetical protein [Halobacillus shinanisalinarum]UOQ91991.1 hypothetical protein MUO14_15970 [Halobacillus shinanisalinarum]
MRVYIYPVLIFLYLLSQIWEGDTTLYIVGIFANLAILISLFFAKGLYLYSGITFYVIGFLLFLNNDSSWHTVFLHFDSMLGILSLFLLLPFLNSLIQVGRYDTNLNLFLKYKVDGVSDLYKRSSFVSHVLGLFLNIATIPLLLRSLKNTLKHLPLNISNKFYSENLLRAYAMCLTWSPLEIMVIKSLEITQESYIFIFPFIFFIAVLTLFLDWYIAKRKYKHLPLETTSSKMDISYQYIFKKIRELFLLLLILVVTVTFFNQLFNQSYLFSLVLLILPISLLWALYIRKVKRYVSLAIPYWKLKTKGLSNYFFMFLSAGFFVEMLATTELIGILQTIFVSTADLTFIFYLMIGGYFLLSSYIGFHPLVSIVLLAELLVPILPQVANISLTLVLIACSLSTVMYSPFNISVSILANQLKMNPYRLGLWNVGFSIGYMLLTMTIAYTLNLFLAI